MCYSLDLKFPYYTTINFQRLLFGGVSFRSIPIEMYQFSLLFFACSRDFYPPRLQELNFLVATFVHQFNSTSSFYWLATARISLKSLRISIGCRIIIFNVFACDALFISYKIYLTLLFDCSFFGGWIICEHSGHFLHLDIKNLSSLS